MKKCIAKNNIILPFYKILIFLFLCYMIFLLFMDPKTYMSSVSMGLSIWATAVLPSLLPFFIITKSITALNIIPFNNKFFKVLAKLFKVPECSIYIFLMSIISGYPVGAKLIAEFYSAGIINEKQATKLVSICSTSGPLFIVGTVGVMFLGSVKLGFILLLSHILGVILNGIIYRNAITKDVSFKSAPFTQKNSSNILYEIMMNSILSVLLVGGYIAIFFMIINMLNNTNFLLPLELLLKNLLMLFNVEEGALSVLNGLIEVTNGTKILSTLALSPTKKVVISSLLIGFGGLCVHMQSITFLSAAKVKLKFYFLAKFTQAIFSGAFAFILMLFFH